MTPSSDLRESVIFPKGEQIKNGPFTGAVRLDMLVPKDSTLTAREGM
ncbi:MAG: hypothetical protein ACXVI3_05725 [Halobacteriota archaeon]